MENKDNLLSRSVSINLTYQKLRNLTNLWTLPQSSFQRKYYSNPVSFKASRVKRKTYILSKAFTFFFCWVYWCHYMTPDYCVKSVMKYGVFSGLFVFSCIRNRKNSVFGHFSRSGFELRPVWGHKKYYQSTVTLLFQSHVTAIIVTKVTWNSFNLRDLKYICCPKILYEL